jgi:hypothetical protein
MKQHNRRLGLLLSICALSNIATATAQPAQWWAWTKEPWKGNDQPYYRIRQSNNQLLKAKNLNDQTLAQLRASALQRPNDALARFRWASYAYCLALLQPDVTVGSGKFSKLPEEFRQRPSPGVYEYTRMRYLMESYLLQSGPHMARLGERLLKRNPNDVPVKYYLVSHLFTGKPQDEQKSVKYAQELVRQHPREGSYYSLLGYSYKNQWWRTKNRRDAQLAVQNYRKYLQLSKPVGIRRKQVERSIKELEAAL